MYPLQNDLSPLNAEQSQQFQTLMGSLNPVQQAWLSGYLAASSNAAPSVQTAAAADAPLTILYGSQTGNAKGVAQALATSAQERGLAVKLLDMADYKPNQLKNESCLAIVVSTYGEGEPPESAVKLHQFLHAKKAPQLDGLQVAVLGLGDSSYEFYCQTATDFEERLQALGASVALQKVALDVDYEDYSDAWVNDALTALEPFLQSPPASAQVLAFPGAAAGAAPSPYSKKNPLVAEVSAVQKITGRDSIKDVRHIEIDLDGSGLSYRVGDSLGVYCENHPAEVDALLSALKLDPNASVGDKSLRDALIQDFELSRAHPGFVERYAALVQDPALSALVSDKTALRQAMQERQVYDWVHQYPAAQISANDFVDCLRKLQPRLYSIASSQAEVENEVHLTVGVVEYEAFDRDHLGACSGFLGRQLQAGDTVRVYVEPNEHFRLPDSSAPVIMVGPGTGIAPFRAFMQEREAQAATGKNWLFFGNPHFTQDFLYQVEWQSYLKSGQLNKIDLAFSRDQAHKVYVQDRIREQGHELVQWLEQGAYLYLCGDGERMAKDVHQALLDVLMEQGGKSASEAQAYLEQLRDEKRYQKDVY